MPMNPKRCLLLIIAAYLLLGSAYSWLVPLGEAPDEIDHYLYIRHLIEARAFPIMKAVAAENETMEANQPPLFYLLNALLTAPFPQTAVAELPQNSCYSFTPGQGRAHFYLHSPAEARFTDATFLAFRVARLISVALGGLTIWLTYGLARQLAPTRPWLGPLAAALLAFNPQFLFINASVNNDVLMATLGAAIIYMATAVADPTYHRHGRVIGLGLLVGLGLLTKFALLAFYPLAFLALLFNGGPRPWRQRRFWLNTGLLVLLPVLLAGWWYLRTAVLYGDPLAWEVHLQAKGAQVLRTSPLVASDLLEFVRIHFQSYWGWFGWLKLPLPSWLYLVLALFVTTAVAGTIAQLWQNRPRFWPWPPQPPSLVFNLLAIAAIYASLLRYILTINWSGYQGRLAFAAAASIAVLLAWGLDWYGRSRPAWLTTAVGGSFFALATAVLPTLIAPAYAKPALFQPDSQLPRICVQVADLQIEAISASDGRVGQPLDLTLYSYAQQTAVEQTLLVQLHGRDGQPISQQPLTDSWQAGDLLLWHVSLPIPETAQAGHAQLQVGPAEALQPVQWLKLAPAQPTAVPADAHPLQADFGQQLRLLAYRYDHSQLTLYWQALAPIEADYTTFVHLLDAQGQLLGQNDSQPDDGWYPTSIWQPDEIVADTKAWPRPLADDVAHIQVGVYLLQTGQRLPLADGRDSLTLFLPEAAP